MNKKNFWERSAKIATFNWMPYTDFLVEACAILTTITFCTKCCIDNPATYRTFAGGPCEALLQSLAVAFAVSSATLWLSLWVTSTVVRFAFMVRWAKVTNSEWVDSELDPWAHHDAVLAELAMNVIMCEDDSTELQRAFEHARFLAETLEHGHPVNGRQRHLGDLQHYVQVYKSNHHTE